MRRVLLLLCALTFSLSASTTFAQDEGKGSESEPLRRSEAARGSYPEGPAAKAPLSTGYYVADNDAPAIGPPWAPNYTFIDTTGNQLQFWRRMVSGPTQRIPSYWTQPGSFGLEYFRNPDNMNDSTDDAFAGPVSIGFPFHYYGRKYDSFYVSTNGLVALTNRRYQYDEQGNRVDYEPVFDDTRSKHVAGPVADTVPDDYGYRFVARGNVTTPTGGIRNPANSRLPNAALRSVLAPLWDDTELSQYDVNAFRPDDFGKVYWRRDETGNKLIIFFVNQSMKGTKNIPIMGITAGTQPRQIRANYQVVLDRTDSSVQYNYQIFRGTWVEPQSQVINVPSNTMFRSNATIGLQSHDLEATNYLFNADFGGAVYVNGTSFGTPHNALAIKFKQWRNVVRVVRVAFQVPSLFFPGQYVDLPAGSVIDNYELLLGNSVLGVVRPMGIVQNVSSDVGPVNVIKQPIRFSVIFRIRDLINVTQPPVYQRTAVTDSLYPIFGASAARPDQDTIIFDPYITNANVPRQVGRFRAEVIALDQGPNGLSYGQEWPFDDTTGVRLFGLKRLEMPFIDNFNTFDVSPEDREIPSVKQWVAIGAQVVDGEASTHNPPPPRGPAGPQGQFNSPVAVLDRTDHAGGFYNGNQPGVIGGDTLASFPINLSQSIVNPILLLSYQRAGKQQNGYPRGYSDNQRVGPEGAVYNTVKDQLLQSPDRLIVEFAEPSRNGIDNIVNIQNAWRFAPFNQRNDRITWGQTAPRWGVFGSGGGSGADTTGKIVIDEFDAGKDFEFFRAYIPIPDRWAKEGPGNKTFRFRLRTEVKMDGNPIGSPADDADNFYVDNVMVVEPDKPEVEITGVRVDWPYTEAPASQARAIPISVRIGNNGSTAATTFGVAMYVENKDVPPPPGFYSYYRYQSIISVPGGRDRIEDFPTWNAQECGSIIRVDPNDPNAPQVNTTNYRIYGRIMPVNFDSYNSNDVSYTDFTLRLGPTFAYDDGNNDVVSFANGLPGKGLNLIPINQDGAGASPFGPSGGSSSGTFAMQFRILTRDTVRGFQAFYAGANQSPDWVQYSIYKQPAGTNVNAPPSGTPVGSTRRTARRGEGIPTFPIPGREFHFDQYVTYMLDTAYVVEPGIYFVTVAQLGETGLELGGDASRQGQVTTIYSPGPPEGVGNYSIPAHPEMRQNRFWYEVTTESGGWNPMLTPTNNPGYPHLNARGVVGPISTFTRGSWIPMVRPYFGVKESNACLVEPVELASFRVTELADALRLDWQTATEINNHGFYVERRVKGAEAAWGDITFTPGAGTSNQVRSYEYTDNDVAVNTTYQYRLRQEDRDGSISYSGIQEGRIASAVSGEGNRLSQNTPNPVNGSTRIGFRVVENQAVVLEITDMYGKLVRSYGVEAVAGESNEVVWDGMDAEGVQVPNGAYVYKLVGNGFTLTRKLTVAR